MFHENIAPKSFAVGQWVQHIEVKAWKGKVAAIVSVPSQPPIYVVDLTIGVTIEERGHVFEAIPDPYALEVNI